MDAMMNGMNGSVLLAVAVGDSIDLGGGETTVSESSKPERRSKTRYVLVLTKYTPTDE